MSDILKAVHETAKGLHKSGAINKTTMRKFDSLCEMISPLCIFRTIKYSIKYRTRVSGHHYKLIIDDGETQVIQCIVCGKLSVGILYADTKEN